MSLRELIDKRFGSGGKAAAALLAASNETGMAKSSLTNSINDLCKGKKISWWKNHGELSAQLAKLLEISVDQLLGEGHRQHTVIDFFEFPSLPPIRPPESNCHFPGNLTDQVHALIQGFERKPRQRSGEGANESMEKPASNCHWVYAKPGHGRRFTQKYLAATRPGDINIEVASELSKADTDLAPENPCPTLLFIDNLGEFSEAAAALRKLDEASRHGSGRLVIILAAFELPIKLVVKLNIGYAASYLDPGWREQLLEWVATRLDNAGRPAEVSQRVRPIRQWLKLHDPDEQAIATPADLLACCAVFESTQSGSPNDLTPIEVAKTWLNQVAIRTLPKEAPSAWQEKRASQEWQALLSAHALNVAVPVSGASEQQWQEYAEQLPEWNRDNAAIDLRLEWMHEAGWLRSLNGRLEPYPVGLSMMLAADQLRNQKSHSKAVPEWSIICVDESRETLTQLTLRAASSSQLDSMLATLTTLNWTSPDVCDVFLAAAVLTEYGARLADEIYRPRLQQKAAAAKVYGVSRTPKSLAHASQLALHYYQFIRDSKVNSCGSDGLDVALVAISLNTPCPEQADELPASWFPGWSNSLTLEGVSKSLGGHARASYNFIEKLPTSELRMLAMADQLVAKLDEEKQQYNENGLLYFSPRLLPSLYTSPQNWQLHRYENLSNIRNSLELDELIKKAYAPTQGESRAKVAERLWLTCKPVAHKDFREQWQTEAQPPVAAYIEKLDELGCGVTEFVLQNLSSGQISIASNGGLIFWKNKRPSFSLPPKDPGPDKQEYETTPLSKLPEHLFRAAVATFRKENCMPDSFGYPAYEGFSEIQQLATGLDLEQSRWLIDELGADISLQCLLTEAVWEFKPDWALQHLRYPPTPEPVETNADKYGRQAFEREFKKKQQWIVDGLFRDCPKQYFNELADLILERQPKDYERQWAARNLRSSGRAFRKLYKVAVSEND